MAAYVPPEGYKPPTKKGTSTAVGKGNQAKPQMEGESDDAYNKRKTQWQKSYDARGGVKLKDMNAGQLNKYVSSGGPNRATNVSTNLGRFVGSTPPPASSNTPQQGPSSTPQNLPNNPPSGSNNPGTPHQGPSSAGASASGGSRQNRTSPLGSNSAGAGAAAGLSQMPGGRRGRRRARQAMRRGGM